MSNLVSLYQYKSNKQHNQLLFLRRELMGKLSLKTYTYYLNMSPGMGVEVIEMIGKDSKDTHIKELCDKIVKLTYDLDG